MYFIFQAFSGRGALAAVFSVCAMLASLSAFAQADVTQAWVRPTVARQTSTGAFMRITAHDDARLVDASSPQARRVEIHEMKIDNGIMKMRPVDSVPLPAGQAVELKSGGYHLMLVDLKAPLKTGASVPITLIIETRNGRRESLTLEAPVRPTGKAAPAAGHHH